MSPVEPESSSSSENQAKPNTMRKKNGSFRSQQVSVTWWITGTALQQGARACSWGSPDSPVASCPVQTHQTCPRSETCVWLGFHSRAFCLLAVWGSGVCRMEDREELLCFAWELRLKWVLIFFQSVCHLITLNLLSRCYSNPYVGLFTEIITEEVSH